MSIRDTLTLSAQFCGPPDIANGGYTAGRLARYLGDIPAEVTLRRPPPLDKPLSVVADDNRFVLQDGDALIAEARPASVGDLELPAPATEAEARVAATAYPGFNYHEFPHCFVCGPGREEADGLRIFAGPLAGRAGGTVAAPWVPSPTLAAADGRVSCEYIWAALDCPGAFAFLVEGARTVLLGQITAEIRERAWAGEPHIVMGWQLGREGRKLFAGTALYTASGELLAVARATWFDVTGRS